MGSPASTYIFNQNINDVYNGNYEVQRVREFYTIGHLLSDFGKIKKFADNHKENKKLYNFLDWNYERGGFWGKLADFQPDLLVADLFAEVYFGNIKLDDGTFITRNFRVMNSIPKASKLVYGNDSEYIQTVLKQVELFENKVRSVAPDTKIIFNGARFPTHMSKNNVIQDKYDSSRYKLSRHEIDRYNQIWNALDLELEKKGFDVLKFDLENSAAELNFPNNKQWYYCYNQNYYTDVQSQIEEIAQKYELGPTVAVLDSSEENDYSKLTQDVVFLKVPNSSNDLKAFRKNKDARSKALALASMDYVLHGNRGSEYRFIKRKQIKTKNPKYKDVHYRVTPPKDSQKYGESRLLVRMFGFTFPQKTSVIERNFQHDFASLKASIVKDTYILEVGDINLIAGSFYTNTKNFPDFEEQIHELIGVIAEKYKIKDNNIVLYGTSRGGTGALLQAALGNYKFIVADPVINDTAWYANSDAHYIKGVRTMDLTSKICSAFENFHRAKDEGVILGSTNVGVTFSSHLRLPIEKFTLIDLNLDLYEHGLINSKSVPIQLSYINQLLIKDTVSVVSRPEDLKDGVVFEINHLAQNAINFEKIVWFRVREEDIKKRGINTYNRAINNIQGKYRYVRSDQNFRYFEKI